MVTKPAPIFAALLSVLLLASPSVFAQDSTDTRVWRQSNSLIGEAKYTGDFAHFDYVNPNAPKGGEVRLGEMGGFDTFNPILPQGEVATGIGMLFETLTTQSMDEISTEYGLLAKEWSYPDDFSSVTFRLNPKAHWHDGEPITPEDVVWSFEKLIELNPNQANYYANVVSAKVTGDHEVTFGFDTTGNRELPQIVAQIPILPKHWWEGVDANGEKRDISRSTLEPLMGSGPYRIGDFTAGRTMVFERVEDYWGADEPVNVGQNNFDKIRYEYFRDTTVEFEAFKGDQFDWWSENISRRWATGYDFAAVQDGRVIRERFENPYRGSGAMVGFVPNLRRPQFQDARVRKALNFAFDFEELQRTLFFGEYNRINSFFYPTELASSGLPEGEELEILESVRDLVPESVFTQPYVNPIGGDATNLRANLREALNLLNAAGYTLDNGKLVDASGKQMAFEILLNGPTIEPVALAFQANLAKIGLDVTVRTVDSPQYINRARGRDFDMIYTGWGQSLSPGNEQRFFFGSQSADQENSSNYAGIADAGVDALIDKVIFADDRESLIAATKALDRVLLAHQFVVPSYAATNSRIARWDRFSHPDVLPEYAIGFPTIWWYDAEKAAATK